MNTTEEWTSSDFWVSTVIPETVDKSSEHWVKIHCQHRTMYLEKDIFHIWRWSKNSLRFSKTKKVSSWHLLEDFLKDVFQENDLPRKSKIKANKWLKISVMLSNMYQITQLLISFSQVTLQMSLEFFFKQTFHFKYYSPQSLTLHLRKNKPHWQLILWNSFDHTSKSNI